MIDQYHMIVNNLPPENPNVAVIVISLNEKLIRTEGLYAPRFFTGIVDVVVKFDDDYRPRVINYTMDGGGEFYEHNYVTDFVYSNMDPSDDDMKKLEIYIEQKIDEVVYGPVVKN